MHDRLRGRRSDAVFAVPPCLPQGLHRRLVDEVFYVPVVYGTCRRRSALIVRDVSVVALAKCERLSTSIHIRSILVSLLYSCYGPTEEIYFSNILVTRVLVASSQGIK